MNTHVAEPTIAFEGDPTPEQFDPDAFDPEADQAAFNGDRKEWNELSRSQQDVAWTKGANKVIRWLQSAGQISLADEKLTLLTPKGPKVIDKAEDGILAKAILQTTRRTISEPQIRPLVSRVFLKVRELADNSTSMTARQFSAFSEDFQRPYVPIQGGLAEVSSAGIRVVPNILNADRVMVQHPEGEPFRFNPGVDVLAALEQFERLLVNSAACAVPEMRWFLGMNYGLFPLVRELNQSRMLTAHVGPSQQGKTSSAERYSILHGLGKAKGDYSIAAYRNLGDYGLLVMDNKEHANMGQAIIDFWLFMATGGESGRSDQKGKVSRKGKHYPVVAVTTIEGLPDKQEIRNRFVEIRIARSGEAFDEDHLQRQIKSGRHEMLSALLRVIQEFLRSEQTLPVEIPEGLTFPGHYQTLVRLLNAYATVTGKPAGWVQHISDVWKHQLSLSQRSVDHEHGQLEYWIMDFLRSWRLNADTEPSHHDLVRVKSIEWDGCKGTLFVLRPAALLARIQKEVPILQGKGLPTTAQGLRTRLQETNLTVMDEKQKEAFPELARKKDGARWGIFVPDEAWTI